MKILLILSIILSSLVLNAFPIPKNKKATFDIIRKNKIIGGVETTFENVNEELIITNNINILVKVLFFPAYKFSQNTQETWLDENFIKFKGHTDFEDEREYFIVGEDNDKNFIATGMDGDLILDKNILPLNYWNKKILNEKELFDTQKGIVRKISVNKLKNEIINIDGNMIETEKYTLDASIHPKDKGPFPQYTIWYSLQGELLKFQFTNWKDKKEIITQRTKWQVN